MAVNSHYPIFSAASFGARGDPGTNRVTRDFVVRDVRYLYEDAVAAGSDHALVVADLVFREPL